MKIRLLQSSYGTLTSCMGVTREINTKKSNEYRHSHMFNLFYCDRTMSSTKSRQENHAMEVPKQRLAHKKVVS